MRPSLQERLEQEHTHGIDLTPLIDMAFILLIFFVVTTVFVKETGVEVEKPEAVTGERLEDELILIAITAGGEVMYDRSNIGVAGVRATVSALLLAAERPVVLQVDRRVTTDLLVRVIDEVKLGGATTVNIATTDDER
jgi:biopolymer transport protein ExbD